MPIDTVPDGCWAAAAVLAIIGACAVVGGGLWLLWWLFQHIAWV
jgi:hypothetical protein